MCLGIPMRIIAINGQIALCEQGGIQRDVALHLLAEGDVQADDYVVVHLGFAIERIRQAEAKDAQSTWREWIAYTDGKNNSNTRSLEKNVFERLDTRQKSTKKRSL